MISSKTRCPSASETNDPYFPCADCMAWAASRKCFSDSRFCPSLCATRHSSRARRCAFTLERRSARICDDKTWRSASSCSDLRSAETLPRKNQPTAALIASAVAKPKTILLAIFELRNHPSSTRTPFRLTNAAKLGHASEQPSPAVRHAGIALRARLRLFGSYGSQERRRQQKTRCYQRNCLANSTTSRSAHRPS